MPRKKAHLVGKKKCWKTILWVKQRHWRIKRVLWNFPGWKRRVTTGLPYQKIQKSLTDNSDPDLIIWLSWKVTLLTKWAIVLGTATYLEWSASLLPDSIVHNRTTWNLISNICMFVESFHNSWYSHWNFYVNSFLKCVFYNPEKNLHRLFLAK